MFIEFIDQLRCVNTHEDSWLVASFAERQERFVVRGTLGCHICHRQYPLVHGVAYFGVTPGARSLGTAVPGDPEIAVQAAAFLNAQERSTLVLAGHWASHAHALTAIVPLRIFAFNVQNSMSDSELVAVIESSEGIPLAARSVDGVALDDETASPSNVASALKVLKPSGRLVAPATTPVPPTVKVLASDEQYWVGEVVGDLISLRRKA